MIVGELTYGNHERVIKMRCKEKWMWEGFLEAILHMNQKGICLLYSCFNAVS